MDDQEIKSPKLMRKDTLFQPKNAYIGKEELGYMQDGRARDIVEG